MTTMALWRSVRRKVARDRGRDIVRRPRRVHDPHAVRLAASDLEVLGAGALEERDRLLLDPVRLAGPT